jgi:hypothetical protein
VQGEDGATGDNRGGETAAKDEHSRRRPCTCRSCPHRRCPCRSCRKPKTEGSSILNWLQELRCYCCSNGLLWTVTHFNCWVIFYSPKIPAYGPSFEFAPTQGEEGPEGSAGQRAICKSQGRVPWNNVIARSKHIPLQLCHVRPAHTIMPPWSRPSKPSWLSVLFRTKGFIIVLVPTYPHRYWYLYST